jgi:hypothetical protein
LVDGRVASSRHGSLWISRGVGGVCVSVCIVARSVSR